MNENVTNTGALSPIAKAGGLGRVLSTLASNGMVPEEPFSQPILLSAGCHVAGTARIPDIDELARKLTPGTKLTFLRERDNLHDRWAIRILTPENKQIGYLPCDINEMPARLMDAGKELYAQVSDVQKQGFRYLIEIEVYLHD